MCVRRRKERLIHARHLRQEDEVPLPDHLKTAGPAPLPKTAADIAAKRAGLMGYGLEITEYVPIIAEPDEHRERYMATKRDKMDHRLPE